MDSDFLNQKINDLNFDKEIIENAIEKNGMVVVHIRGISMYPMLIQGRDYVVIEKPDKRICRWDVPLYRAKSGKLLLHRVLAVRHDSYIIRGDNMFNTEIVPKNQIIGVLKAFYRDGKYYDCATSKKYHAYIFLNRISYPLRKLWKFQLRPLLSRVKHTIFK